MPSYPTTGDDVISDTSGNDDIDALAGNDSITVTAGNDQVAGNAGTDTLVINYASRSAPLESSFHNTDGDNGGNIGTFYSVGASHSVAFSSIDRFDISSGNGDDRIHTGAGNDVLKLNGGNDWAYVGAGVNTADGGTGQDGLSADFRAMAAGVVLDLSKAANSGAFGSYLNFEFLFGILGSAKADRFITQNIDRPDVIDGGAGDDVIAVFDGYDEVHGGSGIDTLIVDYGDDPGFFNFGLVANAAGGLDGTFRNNAYDECVFTSIDRFEIFGSADGDGVATGAGNDVFIMGAGADSVSAGAGNDNLDGGAGADDLKGEAGNDRLDGGADIDTLTGGAGGDVYIVDNSADKVIELSGGGTDTVESSATFTLSGNVENLRLTGTSAIDGTGNGSANSMVGNGAVNVLNGGAGNDVINGGAGADTMAGGTDHDTYVVDNVGDKVIENGSSGTDTVQSSVNYGLPTHVERLVLTGTAGIDGRGNSGDNTITGNSGGNLVNGGSGNDSVDAGAGNDQIYGSLGNDSLKGGAGLDRFLFNTTLGATNVDKILDFSVTDDLVYLARYVFTRAGANGTLNAAAFRQGTAAADASDRIVYDQATGKIFYDSDGTGAAAQILFATVTAGTALTNADFVVYG